MRAKSDSIYYRPDLGLMVLEWAQGQTMGFIGLEVMPLFPVKKQSGVYPVIPVEALLHDTETARAPRGAYPRSSWEYERGSYATDENGYEEPVDDVERELLEQEAEGAADFMATQRAWDVIMRKQEKRIASKVIDAASFTVNNVTTAWDADNSTPIDDINDGVLSMRSKTGLLPDALIISYSTFVNLRNSDQVVERLRYTYPGIDINRMSSQDLARLFNIPRVLVGGAVYNSAGEGLDAEIADIWSNEYAALIKIAERGNFSRPGFGFTFLWTEDSPQNAIVEQYREEQRRSDIFRVRHHTDEALIRSMDNTGAVKSDIAANSVYLIGNIKT